MNVFIEEGIIADLHLHSRFSRACSKNITVDNLIKYAKIKGINLLGTADFTHPIWLKELKENLSDDGSGILNSDGDIKFLLSSEISLIYSQEKGRRVHLLLLAPSFEIVEQINSFFDTKGRRDYDGRPIFNMSCVELTDELKKISDDIEIIPAHIWTPWFSVFGSKSGFDSLKEAFQEKVNKIHAIETGMSSSPEMNWRIKELDDKSILSFSDSHSFWPWRLGREATIFKKADLTYKNIISQIRNNDFIGTIEVDPAYGKYHFDGHRECNFYCSYEKTKELNEICPKCGKKLIIGVDYRVEELADKNRSEGYRNENAKDFYKILPLHELLALEKQVSLSSKSLWPIFDKLMNDFYNEFNLLLYSDKQEMIRKGVNGALIDLILKNRDGKIKVKPGFDGLYGQAILSEKQATLF